MLQTIGCLHLLEGSEEYHIYELLKISLESELETVTYGSVLVEIRFRQKHYLMSGHYTKSWNGGWRVNTSAFAYSNGEGYELYAPVNKYEWTKFDSLEELKAAMVA
nr:MAG: hypothetical protein [uncultured cyanophage]WFD61428.1 MAG: hypothetical protein [uncultured cyanophage]